MTGIDWLVVTIIAIALTKATSWFSMIKLILLALGIAVLSGLLNKYYDR